MSNEEIFEILETKCYEISLWLEEHFGDNAKVVITSKGIRIDERQ